MPEAFYRLFLCNLKKWSIYDMLLIISLELQGKKRQPFFMAQPLEKGRWMRRGISGGGKKTYAVLGKAPSWHVVVLLLQYAENTGYYPSFRWGTPWLRHFGGRIPLEFQEIRHQPLPMTQPLAKLCHSNRLICCCMQFQMDGRGEIFLALVRACGLFFATTYWKYKFLFCHSSVGSWVAHFYWLFFGLCYSLWLFHLHSMLKIQTFSGFPLGGIHGWGILPVIPLEFQGKSINHFL